MPFEISFHPSWRLAITRAWGQITLDDLLSYRQELAARPEFDATWSHVFDAAGAVRFDLSSEEIRHLAATSVLAPSARRALVATDGAIVGLFRLYGTMFELQVDGSAVGVFTTLHEAIEWVTP